METAEWNESQHVVAVAVAGSRKGKYILRWALDQFLPEGNVKFKILHVYPRINVVPTPMGTWLPVSEVRHDLVRTFKQETEWKKKKTLLPFKKALDEQKIESEIIVIESDDIAMSLCLEVERHSIRHLVIGSSSTSAFSWKYLSLTKMLSDHNLSAVIAENAPSFCSVYVVTDGKLQSLRPSESKPTVISVHSMTDSSDSVTDNNSTSSSLTLGRLLNPKEQSQHQKYSMSAKNTNKESKEATTTHYTVQGTNKSYGINSGANYQSYNSGESGSWVSDRTSPGGSFVGSTPAQSSVSIPYGESYTSGTMSSVSIPIGGSYTGGTPPTGSPMSIPNGGSYHTGGTPPTGSFTGTPPTGSPMSIPIGGSYYTGGTPPTGSFTGTPPTGSSMSISMVGGSFTGTCTPPTGSYVGTPPGSFMATGPSSPCFYEGTPNQHQSSEFSEAASSESQVYELEKLRMELRHVEKMYELAQNTEMDQKLSKLSKELEAAIKLQEGRVVTGGASTETIKAVKSGEHGEGNAPRQKGEAKAAEKTVENENELQQLLASPITQCQKFNWNELMQATSSLSEEFKIGSGAFGTVYKCKLHHTAAAVKVLHSKDTVINKQFLQELEILSKIRHPHILLLLGAIPEKSCLVYEYMENGSLDDRLFRKNNCPPLPWYERIRISWEVASALAFLHSTKPKPIIHRDLKPANILLDHHLVSKIGDAGLGTTMNVEPSDKSLGTLYKETSPVGTLCYIDPEYQRTGRVSTKSDVYALGIVILQLLTAKPAVGISYLIEDAIEEETLSEVLDKEAGIWAEDAALELATLGLKCSELRGKDRPDLRDAVLPALEKLKDAADSARLKAANAPAALPTHFLCPISKDVMEDPYIAADGYTYDRVAIEKWLAENTISPTTNLPLPHKFIMPNYTLLEAIKQWKSKQ